MILYIGYLLKSGFQLGKKSKIKNLRKNRRNLKQLKIQKSSKNFLYKIIINNNREKPKINDLSRTLATEKLDRSPRKKDSVHTKLFYRGIEKIRERNEIVEQNQNPENILVPLTCRSPRKSNRRNTNRDHSSNLHDKKQNSMCQTKEDINRLAYKDPKKVRKLKEKRQTLENFDSDTGKL